MIWILLFLGNLINIGYKVRKDLDGSADIFSFIAKWIKSPDNFLYVVLGGLTSVAVLLTVDFNALGEYTVSVITFNASYLIALMIGTLGQWIFNNLVFGFKKKLK